MGAGARPRPRGAWRPPWANRASWRFVASGRELLPDPRPSRPTAACLLHNIAARLHSLRVSHRAFTYREKPKPGELSLQEFLGMDFFTPLEEAVKHLGEAFGSVATFKQVFDTLSDKYFDGLPIMMPPAARTPRTD